MYAGIVIDTNNFMNQAGVRTFEAAAFLRRNGADVVRVRKLFRDRLEDYRARAEAIQKAEIYHGAFPCVRPKDLKVLPWLAHRRQMSCWIL